MLKTNILVNKDIATIYFGDMDNNNIHVKDNPQCENIIVEKLSFDINSNFDPGGESLICYYGIVEVPSNNENIGVEGFK